MTGIKVIVCGGRDYADRSRLEEFLGLYNAMRPIGQLHHGNAAGADRMAAVWAHVNKVPCRAHRANWARDGRAAGPIRNKAMLGIGPDVVIAFPGGRGTANMVKIAKQAGVEVIEI